MIETESKDTAWRGVFRLGSWAAVIAALVFRRWLGAEVGLLHSAGLVRLGPMPQPGDVAGWFALLQSKWLLGLTLLDFFDSVNYVLVGLIFVALYGALRRVNEGAMRLAMALGFVGIAVYLASNQVVTVLALSHQYAAATPTRRGPCSWRPGRPCLPPAASVREVRGSAWGFTS